jgi:hypothetical protein
MRVGGRTVAYICILFLQRTLSVPIAHWGRLDMPVGLNFLPALEKLMSRVDRGLRTASCGKCLLFELIASSESRRTNLPRPDSNALAASSDLDKEDSCR